MEPMRDQGFDPADTSPGTEAQVIAKDERRRLREAIALLPEDQQEALVLTQLERVSYEKAAQMLNVSEGTVKSRVNRAKARLKLDQLLSDMAEDVPPMPDGLHDKWMDSVRAEAAKNENPLPVSVSRWPRILSVAAAFIFLIGGTFIYRSSRKTILPESRPADAVFSPEASVMKEAVTEDADMEEFVAQEAKTEERAMEEDATLAAGAAYETPDYAGD